MQKDSSATTWAETQTREIRTVTVVGSLLNIVLAAVKLAIGFLSSSQALIADGVHSLSDLLTDVAVWAGARLWTAPADDSHPYGHGRLETLINFFIAAMLGVVALGIGWEAIVTIHENHGTPPGWSAFFVALIAIAVKEWLYRWTVLKGREIRSSAVIANAWHHRSDAMSSIPVALAVVAGHFFPELTAIDHVAALIVSILLLKATWDIGWPCIRELMEENSCHEFELTLQNLVRENLAIEGIHAIRCKRLGSMHAVDFHLQFAPQAEVATAHDLAGQFKAAFMEQHPEVIDVLIHIEPTHER